MAKRNMICNLSEEEKREVSQFFTDEYWMTKEEEDELQECMENFLFYEAEQRGSARRCICTHPDCRPFHAYKMMEPNFFRKKHGEYATCPSCGRPVTLQALGRIKNFAKLNRIPSTRFTVCRTAPDGGLLLLSGYAWRYFDEDDLKPGLSISWKEKTYLAPGKRMQWERILYLPYGIDTGWEEKTTVGEPFHPAVASWQTGNDGTGYFIGLREAVARSDLKYCQVEEFAADQMKSELDAGEPMRDIIKYLSAYTEYPNLEMAVKTEQYGLVWDLISEGKKNARDIDWKAKNLQGFFRLNKQDCNTFLCTAEAGGDLLRGYHKAVKTRKTKSMAAFIDTVQACGGVQFVERLEEVAERAGCSLKQAENYIKKQDPGRPHYALQTWLDYLRIGESIELDLKQKDVVMPKNLTERHDQVMALQKFIENKNAESKYRSLTKRLQKMYEFSLGGYRIVVPSSPQEIIKEGETLQHCVKGYANRHFAGETVILFLRKERKPGVSFMTIEMAARKRKQDPVILRQIHGYKNEWYRSNQKKKGKRPEEKFKWFLSVWEEWLIQGSQRDAAGKPVINRKEQTA